MTNAGSAGRGNRIVAAIEAADFDTARRLMRACEYLETWEAIARLARDEPKRKLTLWFIDLADGLGEGVQARHLTENDAAIHEAGHVMGARTWKIRLISATIVSQPGTLGGTEAGPMTITGRRRAEDWALFALAGPAADRLYYRNISPGAERDLQLAWNSIRSFFPTDEACLQRFQELWKRARERIRERQRDVIAVAEALKEKKTLSAREVYVVLRACRRDRGIDLK